MYDREKSELYKDLANNKEAYINACRTESEELADRVIHLYSIVEKDFTKYYSDLLDSGLAAANAVNAYKTKKIDPYIAGGIGQSIGGTGAGIYSAMSTAQRNKEIDSWRADSALKSSLAKARLETSEDVFYKSLDKLEEEVSGCEYVKQIRLKDEYERKYMLGIRMFSYRNNLGASKVLSEIRDYKDSKEVLQRISVRLKEDRKKHIIASIISIIVGVLIVFRCITDLIITTSTNNAENFTRSMVGMMSLFAGLLLAALGTGIAKSLKGLLPGILIAAGSLYMSVGSSPAKDSPNGDLGWVSFGLVMICCGVIWLVFYFVKYQVATIKEIDEECLNLAKEGAN